MNPIRSAARRQGLKIFPDVCPQHRLTHHWVLSGKCQECAHESGKPRSGRAAALKAGLELYTSTCRTHGHGPYWVETSRCVACEAERVDYAPKMTVSSPRERKPVTTLETGDLLKLTEELEYALRTGAPDVPIPLKLAVRLFAGVPIAERRALLAGFPQWAPTLKDVMT